MSIRPIQLGLPWQVKGDVFASGPSLERPVGKEQLMERVLERKNLLNALRRVGIPRLFAKPT